METFNVLLIGRLLPGTDQAEAIDRLIGLTGLERSKAESLLAAGQRTVVKKAVNREVAGLFLDEQLLWIGMTLTLSVLMALMALIPKPGNMVTTLIGPVFAGGMMLGAHAQQQGEPLRFSFLFKGFSQQNRNQLLRLGGLQLLFGIGIGLIGFLGLLPMVASTTALFSMKPDPLLFLLLLLLALGVLTLMSMAFWFAPCLVVINHRNAWDSVRTSFRSGLRNWSALLVFGLVSLLALVAVGVVLALVGMVFQLALRLDIPPFFFQLVLLLFFSPTIALFTLTSYTAYRDVFLTRP